MHRRGKFHDSIHSEERFREYYFRKFIIASKELERNALGKLSKGKKTSTKYFKASAGENIP